MKGITLVQEEIIVKENKYKKTSSSESAGQIQSNLVKIIFG
jgi:hypothetical protein